MMLFFTLLFVIPLEFSAAIGQRCRGSEFKCFWDDSCISRYLLCDGMHDCPHGEDETEWFASCNHCKGMFHCHKDRNGPICQDNDYVCDGFPDCINGEDESFEFAKCGCKRDLAAAELAGRVGCRKKCKKDSDCTKNKAKKKKSKCKDSKPCKNDEKDEKVEACICDYECGMSCVTISKTCPPLSPIPHQRSIRYVIRNRESKVVRESTKPYQYDTQAHYECNPGYEAYPNAIRMCHGRAKEKNSSWTNEVICTPSCDPKNNRLIKQFNLICGKTCVSNNECDGNETCTCDGACGRSCVNQAIDCGEAPSAPGAFIEYTGEKFKRVAHYICVEGTYLDGGDVARKCTGSGKWEGQPAICKPITCPDPLPSISGMGGSIVDYSPPPYYFNTTLEFVCDKGQRLLGSSIRTCMGNGRWSGIDTICDNIGELDRCPHPGIPIGGELMGSGRDTNFMIGQEVEFRCNNGLVLVGDAMQECLFYKRWSGEGVPTCVDPRYSDDSTDVIAKLSESTSNIKRNELIQAGKSVDMNSGGRIEVYFLIDLSSSMKDKHLGNLLDFAKGLVERISKNDTAKRLRFGIVVFATEPYEMLNVLDEPPKTPAQVLDKLEEIKIDYRKIRRKYTQYGTNIRSAITLLNQFQLANSYRIFDEDSVKRHIFTMTDGAHNAGGVPSIEKQNIERAYGENKPEFYSITSSAKDQSFEVREELRKLATNDKNFIYVEDFYKLHKYIDQVTDVREDYETCGKAGDIGSIKNLAVRGRSIGADNAVERAWPWQALITQYDEDLMAAFSDNFLRGGGSLINNKWVLTAAHLFYTYARGIGWEAAIMVTLGMTRRPYHAGAVEGSVKMFQPEKILIHEKYERYKGRRRLGTFQNDVALIKLGKEYILYGARIFVPEEGGIGSGFVEYTPYIRPVCLPCSTDSCVAEVLMKENSKGEILLSGEETPVERCKIEYDYLLGKNKEEMTAVVATGFGHNATRKPDDPEDYIQPSRHLLQAVLKVYERERCEEAVEIINKFSAFNHYIFTDEMFCALGTKDEIGRMTDTCQGDSGGPLVREVYDDSTKESCFVQVGIVSWGYGCGQFTHVNGQKFYYPGFYTDVTSMMSWINNKMKENE